MMSSLSVIHLSGSLAMCPTLQPLQVSHPRPASTRLLWLELRLPLELVVNVSIPREPPLLHRCPCRGREAHHRRPRPDWQGGT